MVARHEQRRRAHAEVRRDRRRSSIARKELLQLRRDRMTLAMMVGAAARAAPAVRLRHQHRRPPHPDRGVRPGPSRPRRATSCARMEATGFYDVVGHVRELRRDRARAAQRRARASRWWSRPLRVEPRTRPPRARAARGRRLRSADRRRARPTPPPRSSPRAPPSSLVARLSRARRADSAAAHASSRPPGTTRTSAPRSTSCRAWSA